MLMWPMAEGHPPTNSGTYLMRYHMPFLKWLQVHFRFHDCALRSLELRTWSSINKEGAEQSDKACEADLCCRFSLLDCQSLLLSLQSIALQGLNDVINDQ